MPSLSTTLHELALGVFCGDPGRPFEKCGLDFSKRMGSERERLQELVGEAEHAMHGFHDLSLNYPGGLEGGSGKGDRAGKAARWSST